MGLRLNLCHLYISGVSLLLLFSLVYGGPLSRNVGSKSRWVTICLTSTMTRTVKAGEDTGARQMPLDGGGVLVPAGVVTPEEMGEPQ